MLAARIKGVTWEEEMFLHPKGHKLERSGTADISDCFHFESSVLSHRAMTKALTEDLSCTCMSTLIFTHLLTN